MNTAGRDPLVQPQRVVALAGGVGGARMADGLAQFLLPENLTVIVNTGDDFDHLGLRICPDLDTVCYTLAGKANPSTGWGLVRETWNALEAIKTLGGPEWFSIGDQDLGTHLERTRRLVHEEPLSQITHDFCVAWGVRQRILPMSDDPVPTLIFTDEGELPFQEYFVHRHCLPRVTGFQFVGVERARPAPGVLEALVQARLVVVCPSNPWVSVDPILAIPGIRPTLIKQRQAGELVVVAVSPIIGGQTVKGPAAKMFAELGLVPSAFEVARHYTGLLDGFMLDQVDAVLSKEVESLGIQVRITNTLMKTTSDRRRLAAEVVDFSHQIGRAAL